MGNKMGTITVGDSAYGLEAQCERSKHQFKVTVDRPVSIMSFEKDENFKKGDPLRTSGEVKEYGKANITRGGNPEAEMSISSKQYAIFDAIRKLDGDGSNLTMDDLAKINSLKGKHGIIDVKNSDFKEYGVATIYLDNGEMLEFDFESDVEIQNAKEIEENRRQMEAEKAAKQKPQEENKGFKDYLEDLFLGRVFLGIAHALRKNK